MPTINKSTTGPTTGVSNDVPDSLKPYVFHGMDLKPHGKENVADCPFCGREAKFSVSGETGQWRCFVCGGGLKEGGGGPVDFIRLLWEHSDKVTNSADYSALAQDRGLEFPETVMAWGWAKNILTGSWILPGYGPNIKGELELTQLYSWNTLNTKEGPRKFLQPTKNRPHCVLGINLMSSSDSEVHVCEGPWDGMRWYEALRSTKQDEAGRYSMTGSVSSSLAHGVSIVAAATCSSFPQNVGKFFKDKSVLFLYDNDHPKDNEKTGYVIPPAGYEGMKRDTAKVCVVSQDIHYIHWGDGGFDPNLADGYDIRDALKFNKFDGIASIFKRMRTVPEEWLDLSKNSGGEIPIKSCTDWKSLQTSWRKAMKWTSGLEHGLVCMLATAASTGSIGDQLWMKIIGPASCGKSTLAEAMSANKKHIIAKSTFRGFHSGYKSDQAGTEDNSFLNLANGKTFIQKDGDTLLKAPNLSEILAEGRDVYDGVSRTHYRNKTSRDYEWLRMTWLLCGTSSLRHIDSSELGERFLDCVVMDGIDEDEEDDILWRVVNKAADHVDIESNGDATSRYSPEMLNAMSMTAGYVAWLRENAANILPTIQFTDEAKRYCIDIGKFVAYMRARPSNLQRETHERELAARLVSQHTRLAKCVAYVLNRASVDAGVLVRVKQVCLDTSRGVVLQLTRALYESAGGLNKKTLAFKTNQEEPDMQQLLRFLYGIGVVEATNRDNSQYFTLTPRIKVLYERLVRGMSTV